MKKVKSGSDISFSFNVKVTDKTTVDEIIREASDIIKVRFAEYKVEPEESEDEKIRRTLVEYFGPEAQLDFIRGVKIQKIRDWLEKQKEQKTDAKSERVIKAARSVLNNWLDGTDCPDVSGDFTELEYAIREYDGEEKQKEQKPIKMEVYEIGKGTTVCGQDYKCKKDYITGTCRYIKDVIYHCSRDGYLNDQNGVSWSCTPEWFKEYIQSNTEWAEEEKTRFVSGQFLQCKLSFDEFKEGEHYWLEYIGDDMYVGRSDNILNQKFHITPRQLYTLFSQQLEEKQKEQKPVEWSEDEQTRKRLIDFISNIKAISESGRNSLAIRKDDAEMCDAFLSYIEKQKDHFRDDTKMVEKQDYSGLNDLEQAIHRGFLSAGIENVPAAIIKETANECKRIANENANAEWSEEDRNRLEEAIGMIEANGT